MCRRECITVTLIRVFPRVLMSQCPLPTRSGHNCLSLKGPIGQEAMSEDEYIAAIGARWPSDTVKDAPSVETIQLADEAVRTFPSSAKLWVMRGDLLQLADVQTGYTLEGSERSYRAAIKADPSFIEGYRELAYFLDVVMGKRRKAKRYFDKARRLQSALDRSFP